MVETLDESHPLMKTFTWCSLFAGAVAVVLGFAGIAEQPGGGLIAIALGGLLVGAAIHVIRASEAFARLSHCSPRTQAIAALIAIPGAFVALTVLLVPLLMYGAAKANSRD